MGAKQVTELRKRLDRDGAVDVRISWVKAAAGSLLWVVFPMLMCVGGFLMAVDGDATGWFVAAFGVLLLAFSWIRFAETFLGRGPALRIAEDGLTIRRWRRPMTVPWSDVVGPLRVPEPGSGEDAFVMGLSDRAYGAYLDSLPRILRRGVHRQNRNGVRLPRVFEVSVSDFEALLDDDTIQSMVTCSAPYDLVLDWGADDAGGSVLRTQAGWTVNHNELAMSSSMRAELAKWRDRTLPISRALDDDDVDWDTYDAFAEEVRSAGESLARALQLELGSGSKVTY